MKPAPAAPHEAVNHDEHSVHEWRVTQLKRLGVPAPMAEADADRVDWHKIAGLVRRAAHRSSPCASLPDPVPGAAVPGSAALPRRA